MRVKLIEVAESIFAGGDVPKDRFSEIETDEYKIPIYANAEKDDGLYGYTDIARVSVPCVTVAARGTIGFTAKRIKPFLPVIRLITVIPDKEKITLDYLYYALRNCKPKSSGTSIPQLTVPDIKNYSFHLVPISRQKEITQILDKVKQLIEMQKKQMDYYDSLIKARFVEMFGDPVENPRNWKQYSMSSVCTKITDGEHGSVPRTQNGRIFLNAKHIKSDGSIDFSTVTYIDNEIHKKIYKRCNPKYGDILLTTTGTIGNVAIVPSIDEFSMDRGITLLKPNQTMVKSVFIVNLLRFESVQNIMKANVHASAIGHLFLNKVMKLPVIIPPMKLQDRFVEFVDQTAKLKLAAQKSLDDTQTLMDSLMQKYFS